MGAQRAETQAEPKENSGRKNVAQDSVKSKETTKQVGDGGKNKTKSGVNSNPENSAGTSKNKGKEEKPSSSQVSFLFVLNFL